MAYFPWLHRRRSTCRQRSLQKGNELGVWPTGAGTGFWQMGHSIGRIMRRQTPPVHRQVRILPLPLGVGRGEGGAFLEDHLQRRAALTLTLSLWERGLFCGQPESLADIHSLAFDDLPPESLALGLESLFDSLLESDFASDFDSGPFCDFESASAAFLYESLR
jgi:hypothetical protein